MISKYSALTMTLLLYGDSFCAFLGFRQNLSQLSKHNLRWKKSHFSELTRLSQNMPDAESCLISELKVKAAASSLNLP